MMNNPDPKPRIAYYADIRVAVHLDHDPGIDNPTAYEPPYDYPVVREAELLRVIPGPHMATARHLIEFGGTDDFDPDGLLVTEVVSASSYARYPRKVTMTAQHAHVAVSELTNIIDDPQRGVISLVGDNGGLSLITGPIADSSLVPGTLSIETEHGVIHLEPEYVTEISEELTSAEPLDSEELIQLNDVLTGALGDMFDWHAQNEDDYDTLNNLTHATAKLLAPFKNSQEN